MDTQFLDKLAINLPLFQFTNNHQTIYHIESKSISGFMDVNLLLKVMKKEQQKQKGLKQNQNEKELAMNELKKKKLKQQDQSNDDYFSSTINSFLISEKTQPINSSQGFGMDSTFRQYSEPQVRSTSQSFFRKTTDAFKLQHNRQISLTTQQSSNISPNLTQSKFFMPNSSINESGFKKKISERNNNSVGGDIFSPSVPSTVGVFKPFRDIMQTQHKGVYDKFMDNSVNKQEKIKQQLVHNSAHMSIIKDQLESDRINSFDNILYMKKYTDNLMSKAGTAKKQITQLSTQRKDHFKSMQVVNNSSANVQQSLPQLQQGSPSIIGINLNSNQEIDDNNNDQMQNNPEDLNFHWEKVVNYSNELKPEFREGATLVEYKSRFYLYGGFGFELMNNIYQFKLRDYKWRKIDTDGETVPSLGRFGHSANVYKNQMIIFGGGGDYSFKIKNRLVLNELWMLNLDNFEWKQVRTSGYVEPRRHHAACVVGNNFYVLGGIGSNEHYLPGLHVLQIEKGRWKTFNFKQDELGIAFHQMVPIFRKYLKLLSAKQSKIQSLLNQKKNFKIKEEGIYCFGGKQGNERTRGKVVILKCDQKDMPVEWIVPETLGQNPPARFQHSFFYNYQIKGIVLYGGRTDETTTGQSVFQDVWVLYITNLMWVNINVSGTLSRYRFAHSFATIDERMFVFGGASNISYTDCELYVLEMDQAHAMRKRNNPVRDMISRQISQERLEDEESELAYQERNKNIHRRPSGVKTFLRPPTKDELKTYQQTKTIPIQMTFDKSSQRKSIGQSQDFSPRSQQQFTPRLRKESIVCKPKQQSLFSSQINN